MISISIKVILGASQVTLVITHLPAVQELEETWVLSLGQEDPLEEEMAAHFSILAWNTWTEEPGRLQSTGPQRVGHNQATEHTVIFRHNCQDRTD